MLRRNMEAYAQEHDVRGLMGELTQSILVRMPEDPRRFLAAELGRQLQQQADDRDELVAMPIDSFVLSLHASAGHGREGVGGRALRWQRVLSRAPRSRMARYQVERELTEQLRAVLWGGSAGGGEHGVEPQAEPSASLPVPAPPAILHALAGEAQDPVEARDLVRGLQLHDAVLAGIVEGLGLEGPSDGSDVSAALRGLDAAGVESLFQKHCVPRLVTLFAKSVDELCSDGFENVASANSRYADDPRSITAMLGNIDTFEGGFTDFNGKPHPDNVLDQMKAEFASDEEFTTTNYGGVKTSLRTEWEFAVAPVEGKVYPGECGLPRGDGTFYPGRNRKTIDALMKLATSIEAKLVREEVIAVRLYTGPAFMCLNRGLRAGGRKAKRKGIQNFPATCAAFNSAIKKIRLVTQLPKDGKLYRGIAGMALEGKVLEAGSFVELAYTSATPDYAVAKMYAGSDRASLFEILVGQIDRGAFIGEYSQYDAEEEHVLAPLSHYEIVGKRREEGVNIYTLRLNVNGKTETLEELRQDRRTQVLGVAEKLNQDFLELTGRDSLQVSKIVKAEIEPVGYAWFNEGRNFTQIMAKLEEALLRELEEEEEELRQAADALPETEAPAERVAKLRTCAKLSKRCSAGDADGKRKVLAAQERLVAAMLAQGPAAMCSTAAAADDMVELAMQLYQIADYPRALQMLERALRAKQALQPPVPPAEIALIYYWQGVVVLFMGRFDESLVQHEEALKIRTRLFGAEHEDVAGSHFRIGQCYRKKGDLENALFHGKKALEIRTRIFGAEHSVVASSCNFIGMLHWSKGDLESALLHYQKAAQIQTHVSGSLHSDVAVYVGNVGDVLKDMGRYEEALVHMQKALDIKIKLHGSKYDKVAISYSNIGELRMHEGKYEEALEMLEKSLEIDTQVFGSNNHPHIAETKESIGQVLKEMGKTSEAQQKFTEAADIRRKFLGADHDLTKKAERLAADVAASL